MNHDTFSGQTIFICGSGKMGLDIGAFFLQKGYRVFWLTRSADRLAQLQKNIAQRVRRIIRLDPESAKTMAAHGAVADDGSLPRPDIIIESITESLGEKRRLLEELHHFFHPDLLYLSNSSSYLPEEMHPRCCGVHFFYPVALTGLVELVYQAATPDRERLRVENFLSRNGIIALVQTAEQAFAVNRLLLPLQAECFRCLQQGWSVNAVESASRSELLPFGLPGLMDSIGLDVLLPAIENYVSRLAPEARNDYALLVESLQLLIRQGKKGAKNKNGLLCGDPLPWPACQKKNAEQLDELHKRFLFLFINSCQRMVASRSLTDSTLDQVFSLIFQAMSSMKEVTDRHGRDHIRNFLTAARNRTKIHYFSPEPCDPESRNPLLPDDHPPRINRCDYDS